MSLSYPTVPVNTDLAAILTAGGFSTSGLTDLLVVAAAAGVSAFEAETGRKWSSGTETRYFDRPLSESGILLLDGELASLTSVTLGGVALTQNSTFWLLPDNGPVYTSIRLPVTVNDLQPGTTLYRAVAVTGVWGNANVPADAWLAMVWLGLGELLPLVLANAQAAGTTPLTSVEEAGVTEKYTDFQSALQGFTQERYDRTVKRYQRWLPG